MTFNVILEWKYLQIVAEYYCRLGLVTKTDTTRFHYPRLPVKIFIQGRATP